MEGPPIYGETPHGTHGHPWIPSCPMEPMDPHGIVYVRMHAGIYACVQAKMIADA